MGNLPSVHGEEEDFTELELDNKIKQNELTSNTEVNLYDFSVLFNTESLLKALINIKDDNVNELDKKRGEVEQWLKGLTKHNETTVSITKFVDFADNKGVSREEAMQFFSALDPDGQGSVDVTFALQMLKDRKGPNISEALLLTCNLLPGLLDTYMMETPSSYSDLGTDIIKFLRRYRVDSSYLTPSSVTQLASLFQSRERLVKGRYLVLKERQIDISTGGVSSDDDEDVKVLVTKCYTALSASSNERTLSNLTDNNTDTYWQSNGSPRSHWIRIQLITGIRLKELAIAVKSSDDSYMPKGVKICVGNSTSNMKELRTLSIPREYNGRFVLLGSLSSEYKYLQLYFRSCHSDGCDTRIRQLYIKGYKCKREEEQPTVMDGLLMWYMNLIAVVAKAAMPLTPTLRDTILSQSKLSLQHLPPFSLSKCSPRKPEFVTPIILKEMNSFVKTLCLPGENFVSVDAESFTVLLGFALTTGDLNNILDCLQILMDNVALELPLTSLMNKMNEIEASKFKMHAPTLNLSIVKCDNDEDDKSALTIFTNDLHGSGVPFKSIKDKKVLNVIVKEEMEDCLITLVRFQMKVPTGDTGARAVLIFSLDNEISEIESKEFLDKFSKFDTWTNEEWETGKIKNDEEIVPLTYLEVDKDSKEADMNFTTHKPTKYLLLKFLGQDSSEHISITCVKIRGYRVTPQLIEIRNIMEELNELCSIPTVTPLYIEGRQVMVRTLVFLCRMLQDLSVLHTQMSALNLDPEAIEESHVSTENLSLEKIWNLYIPLTLSLEDGGIMGQCSLLCLILLRFSIQFLKSTPLKENKDTPPIEGVPLNDNSSIPSAVLSHLCSLMDNKDTSSLVQSLARDIIREGVVVFFPGSKARKKYLLDMVEVILTREQPPSWWLKFEALCRYFSKIDNNSLLELNWDTEKDVEIDPVVILNIVSTVITVATKQVEVDIETGNQSRPDDLVRLLCAMQSTLLFWCQHQLTADKKDEKVLERQASVNELLKEYVNKIYHSCCSVLRKVDSLETISESLLEVLRSSIIGETLPELITFLGTLLTEELPIVFLLNTFQPLASILNDVCTKVKQYCPRIGSEEMKSEGENVIAVWTRESKHNYEDNAKITEDFICPTAQKFVIEFDSRCHTERRYDYLQFTDSIGKQTFDDTFGSDRWPSKAEFKGPKLNFYFSSDGSNNYWGYKFTLKAYGKTIPPFHWLFDLQISFSRLLGLMVSTVLAVEPGNKSLKKNSDEEKKEEEALLRSDLWKTLFRGGYQVGKLMRSLSGAYATNPTDSALSAYLFEMAEEEELSPLIEICRVAKPCPLFGGPLVDRAIGAVFAALIWHSQEIRDELSKNLSSPKPTRNVLDAFSAAEALRRELVEARQKILEAKEKEEDEVKKSKMDEDEPLVSCHEKAVYLLKFAGLSRVMEEDRPGSPVTRRPSWGQKSWRWQRVGNVVSTVGRLKQQISREISREVKPHSEKHPSFEMVLSFVRNNGLTVDKVRTLLQERAQLAKNISDVFSFAAEFLRVMISHGTLEIPLLAFLQHLLTYQRRFPRHYAMRVDGCGLDLETRLRKSFQLFIHRLLDAIKNRKEEEDKEGVEVIRNVFSHLLDMTWQDYDHFLLRDIQLPEFLIETVIKSSLTEKKVVIDLFEGEEKMLEKHKLHMKFMEKWDTVTRFTHFLESDMAQEDLREANLFVVAMAANTEKSHRTKVNCDGCGNKIEGPWYRNLEIDEDCDLCPTCFSMGSGNRPSSHTKEHLFQHMSKHICEGCGMSILTHRFQRKSDKTNYCIACFRKESGKDTQWILYQLTEKPATSNSNKYVTHDNELVQGQEYCDGILIPDKVSDGVLYNRHHSWLLFSSLSLSMAQKLTEDKPKSDSLYQRYACELLLTCVQLISHGLKFALAAAKDNNMLKLQKELEMKEKEERRKKEEEEKRKKEEEERLEKERLSHEHRVQTDIPEETDSSDIKEKEKQDVNEKQGLEDQEDDKGEGQVGKDQVDDKEEEHEKHGGKDQEDDKEEGQEKHGGKDQEDDKGEGQVGKDQDGDKEEGQENGKSTDPQTIESTDSVVDTPPVTISESVPPINQSETTPTDDKSGTTPVTAPTDDKSGTTPVTTPTDDKSGTTPVTTPTDDKSGTTPVTTPTDDKSGTTPVTISTDDKSGTTPVTTPTDGISNAEKAFGLMYCDAMLGLLSSILPKDLSLHSWIALSGNVEHVVGDTLLPQLFRLARSSEMSKTQQLQTTLVAIKYMSRVSPEVADRAIEVLEGVACEEDVQRKKTNGLKTVQYLFELGATYLKEADISGAATISECLLLLSKNPEWKATVTMTIGNSVSSSLEDLDLSMIFGLLVFAGFPKLSKVGSTVQWTKGTTEEKCEGIIVSPVNDTQARVVNIKTREPHSIKLSELHVEENVKGCVSENRLPELLSLIKMILPLVNQESPRQVEHRWVLSLCLKALSVLLNSAVKSETVIEEVLNKNLLPGIVKLACKPTHFNKQWFLTDLEILGISCYKPAEEKEEVKSKDEKSKEEKSKEEKSKEKPKEEVDGLEQEKEKDEKDENKEEEVKQKEIKKDEGSSPGDKTKRTVHLMAPKTEEELEEEAALRDLSEEIREMLKIMKDAFQCSLAVVRAMYENAEQDMDKFIMSSDKFYDTDASKLKLPDEILQASRKWMPFKRSSSVKEALEKYQEDQEDTGVTGFITIPVDLKKIDARSEDPADLKKTLELIPKSKESKKKVKEMGEKEKSHTLLQDQLKELNENCDREFMLKVNRALVVLHAREVLASLLIRWPREAPLLNSTVLGGLDISQWFSLLDFLVKGLDLEAQNKILRKVVSCSEPTELVSLGLTAAQCMKEVTVAMETKEFKYPVAEKTTYTDKIVIPEAACLKITMETNHTLHGSVDIASDEEFTEHHWAGVGSGEKKREEQEKNVPGNVLHYKVTLDNVEKPNVRVWSFKVDGLQMGRFDTSYSLLRILLEDQSKKTITSPTWLPIVKLWPSLIAAACDLTGEERIKLIGLLLQVLCLNSKIGSTNGASVAAGVQKLDLTLLKPLWSLYTTMSKEYDKSDKAGVLKPEILRALTELFLVVENTAQDWGVEQDLMVETITQESLSQWLEKGISNVAYLTLGLGLTNKASEIFIEAKKKYVPPAPRLPTPPPLPEDEHDSSSSSSSSSSESDSDSDDTNSSY